MRRIGEFRAAFAARKLDDSDIVFLEPFDEGASIVADDEIPPTGGLAAQARLQRLAVCAIEDDDGRRTLVLIPKSTSTPLRSGGASTSWVVVIDALSGKSRGSMEILFGW